MTQYISPLQDEDLRKRYELLAAYLSGKIVTVHFRFPLAKNADGESFLDESGVYRVNIAPGVSIQKSYEILLHEAAHIRLGHPQPITERQYSLSVLVDAREVNTHEGKAEHDAADKLADEWYYLGEGKIKKQLRFDTDEKQRALMNVNALLTCNWIAA